MTLIAQNSWKIECHPWGKRSSFEVQSQYWSQWFFLLFIAPSSFLPLCFFSFLFYQQWRACFVWSPPSKNSSQLVLLSLRPMAFTPSGDPFLFPLQEQGLKTDTPTITVRCIDPVMSLSQWNSDSLFIPKSQSTLDGQLQRHYQGHLAIKWDWLGYVGWRWETAGLQPQASWPGCMWHQHMQVDSVWWERCCRKGGCYSNAGWFWVLLFSSVPIGNLCGTCSKPYGSVWGLPAPLSVAAVPSRLSVSERCHGRGCLAASNGWLVGKQVYRMGLGFQRLHFPQTEMFERKGAKHCTESSFPWSLSATLKIAVFALWKAVFYLVILCWCSVCSV